jgi:hypothetical protein
MWQFDPVTGALIFIAIQKFGGPVAELGKDVLGRILAPSADFLGEKGRAYLERKLTRASDTIQTSSEMLNSLPEGIEPVPVPARVFRPILQLASDEEDSEVRKTWAAMLANFADPTVAPNMLPAFTEILRNLSPIEVHILNWVYQKCMWSANREQGDYRFFRVDSVRLLDAFPNLRRHQYYVLADNLIRLKIFNEPVASDSNVIGDEELMKQKYESLHLSPFGEAFIKACRRDPAAPPTQGHLIHR